MTKKKRILEQIFVQIFPHSQRLTDRCLLQCLLSSLEDRFHAKQGLHTPESHTNLVPTLVRLTNNVSLANIQ